MALQIFCNGVQGFDAKYNSNFSWFQGYAHFVCSLARWIWVVFQLLSKAFLLPANEVAEGNVFIGVCHSVRVWGGIGCHYSACHWPIPGHMANQHFILEFFLVMTFV